MLMISLQSESGARNAFDNVFSGRLIFINSRTFYTTRSTFSSNTFKPTISFIHSVYFRRLVRRLLSVIGGMSEIVSRGLAGEVLMARAAFVIGKIGIRKNRSVDTFHSSNVFLRGFSSHETIPNVFIHPHLASWPISVSNLRPIRLEVSIPDHIPFASIPPTFSWIVHRACNQEGVCPIASPSIKALFIRVYSLVRLQSSGPMEPKKWKKLEIRSKCAVHVNDPSP
ncbi:hypothetical protein CROQUDRAFT_91713 [Cronartium quercuum f. sp. fusiforme G11]|uniref:Uncharacterized protein n=1 Tax=Cronartium quercuum f. sp. fusiforme G11 TaxID=708437 RepID=A0A9P6NPJ8_9BASI|nr:hypothetical protein CROQUDRAFT_91713 [Cronartium quercuum f. sp. fusiforme G11]